MVPRARTRVKESCVRRSGFVRTGADRADWSGSCGLERTTEDVTWTDEDGIGTVWSLWTWRTAQSRRRTGVAGSAYTGQAAAGRVHRDGGLDFWVLPGRRTASRCCTRSDRCSFACAVAAPGGHSALLQLVSRARMHAERWQVVACGRKRVRRAQGRGHWQGGAHGRGAPAVEVFVSYALLMSFWSGGASATWSYSGGHEHEVPTCCMNLSRGHPRFDAQCLITQDSTQKSTPQPKMLPITMRGVVHSSSVAHLQLRVHVLHVRSSSSWLGQSMSPPASYRNRPLYGLSPSIAGELRMWSSLLQRARQRARKEDVPSW